MKDSIKTGLKLFVMAFIIWWEMGHPIPQDPIQGINLFIALGTTVYTGWANFDFTDLARKYTGLMRIKKLESKANYIGELFGDDDE